MGTFNQSFCRLLVLASGGPFLEEAFKEGKGILEGKIFNFFSIRKSYIFLVIPGSLRVHMNTWFQNLFLNKARAEVQRHTDMNYGYIRFHVF